MTTIGSFHEENGGSVLNMRARVVVATALLALALAAGAGPLGAHDGGEMSEQTIIKSREFTIPKGQCSQLPADVEVKGLGLERTTTIVESAGERVKHAGERDEGRITYSLSSTITGTATDNLGGTYTFSYQLRFKTPSLIPGSGIATDNFKLTGTGAADGMSTFFRARVTFDSGANPVGFEILEQTGDPFHCDPL
jgi:hypothetical protein